MGGRELLVQCLGTGTIGSCNGYRFLQTDFLSKKCPQQGTRRKLK